jgi:hypothetical protein
LRIEEWGFARRPGLRRGFGAEAERCGYTNRRDGLPARRSKMIVSVEMRKTVRLLFCVAGLAGIAAFAYAEEPVASPSASAGEEGNAEVQWPSPDGKFAFVTSYGEDLHTIDLVDKKSGKKLQRIDEEDSEMVYWHVLWAPDSKRLALMTRSGHPIQGIDIYFRNGHKFRKIDLPELPEANIPDKLKHGKSFPHFANLNWQEAEEWKKDGSLVVTIETMIDGGDGGSIDATRTVVLKFDKGGKVRIAKSTIKYETEDE